MYHYSAHQALMQAKQRDRLNQAARARAVREADGRRARAWFARSIPRPQRRRVLEAAPLRPALERPSIG